VRFLVVNDAVATDVGQIGRIDKELLTAGKGVSVQVPGIGRPVLLVISKRARRLSITVKSDASIKMTIPRGASLKRAGRFLESKTAWIQRSLKKLKDLQWLRQQGGPASINRTRARTILVRRLRRLAELHGFEYNRVAVRNQTTRWGSCSDKNNINLNVNLLRLPEELRDYVMLHELVHTRIKNHSKRFWSELDKLVGDGRAMQKIVGRYRIR
jgi:predicted metal-dependent hydrolase